MSLKNNFNPYDMNEELKKIIVVNDCMGCPKVGKCVAWKKLTPQQRIKVTIGVNVGKFILKGCPLDDAPKPLSKIVTDNTKVNIELLERYNEAVEALKSIERECDNQNPTHENIWRISKQVINKSKRK